MFDARNIKPAAAMHMSSFSSSTFSLKRHVMYSLNCSSPLAVDRTKQNQNIQKVYAFCRMCVYVDVNFTFVSVCYIFVSLVWIRP